MTIDQGFKRGALRFSNVIAILCCAALVQACGGGSSGDSPPVSDGGSQPPPPGGVKGSVSLVAGSLGGAGNLNGSGAAARFNGPLGLALDAAGNLYVADARNQMIRKVTPQGRVSTLAGSGQQGFADGAASAATFCYPTDVATDARGNVFVAGSFTLLRRIAPDSSVATIAGTAPQRCGIVPQGPAPAAPNLVATDASGNLYVNDFPRGIYKITPAGSATLFAAGDSEGSESGAPGRLGFVQDLAVDAAGNVYVATPATIQKITPAGQITMLVPASAALGRPSALALDAAGNLYVADASNQVIRKITPAGVITILAGAVGQPGTSDGPGGAARFNSPSAIAVDPSGSNTYVGDGSDTIRRIDASGNVTTLAGLAAPADLLFGPYHATDRAGNVFVAVRTSSNPDDYAIRRIAPDGSATTLVAGGLKSPQGMALDGAGSLYVADTDRSRTACLGCGSLAVVLKITPQGGMTTLAGSLTSNTFADVDGTGAAAVLRSPSDLAIDGAGNLYLGQRVGSPLRRITSNGVVTTPPVNLPGDALGTGGIGTDAAGNLYLSSCPGFAGPITPTLPSGAVVVKFDPRTATTAVLAGSPTTAGYRDGAGAQALFGASRNDAICPMGVALDAAGNVFVADTGNDVVRKIASDGFVSTVVGQAGMRGITLGPLPATLSAPTDLSFDGAGNLYVGSAQAVVKVQFAR